MGDRKDLQAVYCFFRRIRFGNHCFSKTVFGRVVQACEAVRNGPDFTAQTDLTEKKGVMRNDSVSETGDMPTIIAKSELVSDTLIPPTTLA